MAFQTKLSSTSGEAEIKFQTFLNYLRQFNDFIENEYGSGPKLAKYIWNGLSTVQATKDFDRDYLARSLRLAWNTETIACSFGLDDVEALKVNNHWKPVQVYYAIYSGTEAVSHLLTTKTRFSHKAVLKNVGNFYVNAKIYPWGYGFKGEIGKGGNQAVGINFPANFKFGHNLNTRNANPIEVLATCLHAEHKKRVADIYEERKSKKKKDQKIPYKYKTDPPGITTLFDFSYRLRLRSNYQSADMFHANVPNEQIIDFDKYLNQFCARTLCALEILVIKKIGRKKFLEFYNSFYKKVKYNKQLENRIGVYRTF